MGSRPRAHGRGLTWAHGRGLTWVTVVGSPRLTVVGPCGSWSWVHPHLPTSQAHGPGRTALGSWPWAHPAQGCELTMAHGRGFTPAQEALLGQVSATALQGLVRRSLHTGLPIRLEDLASAAEAAEPRAAASPIEGVPQHEPAFPQNGAAPLPAGSEVSLAAEVPGGPGASPCWLQPAGRPRGFSYRGRPGRSRRQ